MYIHDEDHVALALPGIALYFEGRGNKHLARPSTHIDNTKSGIATAATVSFYYKLSKKTE